MQFNGADLKGIRIAGADLSYGVFDCAQLQRADLRNVRLQDAWLREADVSGSLMGGVQFGELPSLSYAGPVFACQYSPDGQCLAITEGFRIDLYNTSTFRKVHSFNGHDSLVLVLTLFPVACKASQSLEASLFLSGGFLKGEKNII